MASSLNTSMSKTNLDKFLLDAFGVEENIFNVAELFDAAKQGNATAWASVAAALELDNGQSARLLIALNKARSSKAPAPTPPAKPTAVFDKATLNRMERLSKATVGQAAARVVAMSAERR